MYSPVNVGYSYSDDPRDRVFDEATVAADLLDFLEEFFLGALYPCLGPMAADLMTVLALLDPPRGVLPRCVPQP